MDISFDQLMSAIYNAWQKLIAPAAEVEQAAPATPNDMCIQEIYQDYIIVRDATQFLRVPYVFEQGRIVFAPREKWEQVERQWEPTQMATMSISPLKAISKDDETMRVGNYIALWGGRDLSGVSVAKNPDGSLGEYFTKSTNFESDYTRSGFLHVDWEHGWDPDEVGNDPDVILGYADWKTARMDDNGLYVERVLLRRHRYMQWLEKLIEEGLVGTSSSALASGVKKANDGGILNWPLYRDTLTITPMEPRMLGENVLTALKALNLLPKAKEGAVNGDNQVADAQHESKEADGKDIEHQVEPTEEKSIQTDTSQGDVTMTDNVTQIAAPQSDVQAILASDLPADVKATLVEKALVRPVAAPAPASEPEHPPYSFQPSATQAKEDKSSPNHEAIYAMRFGAPNESVKAVLTDLYGADYYSKQLAQSAAFNRYLRGGDKALKSGDMDLLKQVILTPAYAEKAIREGWDIGALRTTMVESIDELGGFAVPVQFQESYIERLMGLTVVRPRTAPMRTSRDRVEIPVVKGGDDQYTSGVRVTWVDEVPTAGAAATNLTFGMEGINVHTVMAEIAMSRNWVEDAAGDAVGTINRKFAEARAIDEDNQFLVGDGVGKPEGIIKSGTTPATGVTQVASGDADDITSDGLVDLSYAIASQYRRNAAFVGERLTYAEVRKLKDPVTGRYLWENSFAAAQPPLILGYQALEQEIMPTVAANSYPLIFGDFAGYTIADRIGMTVERFLDSSTARTNTVMFVMRARMGGQVTEPWRFAVQKCATSV